MALVHFNFESQYLQGNTDVNIILPDKAERFPQRSFMVPVRNIRYFGCCMERSEIIPTGFGRATLSCMPVKRI